MPRTKCLANIIQPAMKGLVPTTAALLQNSPNPFRAGAAIRFNLVESGRVTVQVFDVSGRLVSTLAERDYEPGSYSLDWQGVDESGQRVKAGVYFHRLITPDFGDTRRMLLVR